MLTSWERKVFARLGDLLHAFDPHITYQFRGVNLDEASVSSYPDFASALPGILTCASPLTEAQASEIFNTLNDWKIKDVGVSFCVKNDVKDYYPFFCVTGVFYSGCWPWSFRAWIHEQLTNGIKRPLVEYLKIDNLRWLFFQREDIQGIMDIFPNLKELEYIFDPDQEDYMYPGIKMDHEVVEEILGEKARPRVL